MGAFGGVLGFAGVATLVVAFFFDSAASGSRVANIDLMNFKLLLAITGGSFLVAGAVLLGADEVRQAIRVLRPTSSKADGPTREVPEPGTAVDEIDHQVLLSSFKPRRGKQ